MSLHALLDSAPSGSFVRVLVDGVPRALFKLDDERRERIGASVAQLVGQLPPSASARVEVADDETAPARAFLTLGPVAALAHPAPAPTPADQLRGMMAAVEGFGRLGLHAVDRANAQQLHLLDRLSRENGALRDRIDGLETRLSEAWEASRGGRAELAEAEASAETRRELFALGGTLIRVVGARFVGGKGGAASVAKLDAVRRAFDGATLDTLAGVLGQLNDAQRLAVMDLLREEDGGADEPPPDAPAPPPWAPLQLVARANRGTT